MYNAIGRLFCLGLVRITVNNPEKIEYEIIDMLDIDEEGYLILEWNIIYFFFKISSLWKAMTKESQPKILSSFLKSKDKNLSSVKKYLT